MQPMSYNNSENHRDELHPAHSAYIKDLPLNTAEYFIGTLDALEPEIRRKMTGYAVWLLNGFSAQTFENNEEDYVAFKKNLRRLSGHSIVALIIVGIVHLTLSELIRLGDTADVESAKQRLVGFAEHLIKKDPTEIESESMKRLVDHIERIPAAAEEYRQLYISFCENVVAKLFEEPLPNP